MTISQRVSTLESTEPSGSTPWPESSRFESSPPESSRPEPSQPMPPDPVDSAATGQAPRPGLLRRHGWWLALIALVAAGIVWRATSGSAPPADFQAATATPVRAASATVGDLDLLSTYPGEMVGEIADIAPEVSGVLRSITVRIGDRVERGQTLAVIDDVNLRNQSQEARGQLGVAEANESRSEAELAAAISDYDRATELMEQRLLSEQEYDRISSIVATSRANVAAAEAQTQQARARLRLLEQQLADSRVVAPFDGTVAARYVDRGTLVQPGTPIVRLVQESFLRVQFRVPERDLGAVRVGVPFTATSVATGDRAFPGTVERVSGEVSRSDRTAIVEGELTQTDEVLKPGMYAQVLLQLREIRDSVLIPSTAVVDRIGTDGSQSVGVFVVETMPNDSTDSKTGEQDGVANAIWIDIETLGSSEGVTAVRGALEGGATVLTMGHRDLRDGAAIRVVQTESFRGQATRGQATDPESESESEPNTGGGGASR